MSSDDGRVIELWGAWVPIEKIELVERFYSRYPKTFRLLVAVLNDPRQDLSPLSPGNLMTLTSQGLMHGDRSQPEFDATVALIIAMCYDVSNDTFNLPPELV